MMQPLGQDPSQIRVTPFGTPLTCKGGVHIAKNSIHNMKKHSVFSNDFTVKVRSNSLLLFKCNQ